MNSRSDDRSDKQAVTIPASAPELAQLRLDLVTACNRAEDTAGALQGVIDRICEFAGFAVGHAYLIAGDGPGMLRSAGIFDTDPAPEYSAFRHRSALVSFHRGEGMAGRALSTRSAVWINDYPGGQFARSLAAGEAGLRTACAIPILLDSEALGVLEFFLDHEASPQANLLDTLVLAAEQVGCVVLRDQRLAAGIAQALINEELKRRNAIINHIDEAIEGNRAIGHTLDLITHKIVAELQVDAAHVLLCEAEDSLFELLPAVSPAARVIHFPTQRHRSDPARRAAIDGEPVHIDNVHDLEPHEALPGYMSTQGVRSYYAVPLLCDGRLNGILELCGKTPQNRNQHWHNTLHLLAAQTAAALEQYRSATEGEPPSDLRKAA